MLRVKISRATNYYLLGGRKNQMVCSRIYAEHRTNWEKVFNWIFQDKNHCKKCWYYDARSKK